MLQNADVKACLSDLHNKYVLVPADKAPDNIIIICKRHGLEKYCSLKTSHTGVNKAPNNIIIRSRCKRYYKETLIKELGLDNCSTPTENSTYTSCQMSSEDVANTHDTFMKSLGIELSDDDKRLSYLYWTSKLHKSPVKHHFIAGSSKCTTKQLSSLLTKILTVIKTGLEKYCSIKTSHTGVNKAPNNIIIICKRYYKETLIKELGLHNCSTPTEKSTYTSCQMSSEDIANTHNTFMKSLDIELSDDDKR